MSVNPNYGGAPDFSVVALESALDEKWQKLQVGIHAIYASIYDRKLNFRKGLQVDSATLRRRIGVVYDERPAVNMETMPKTNAQMVPTAYPNYIEVGLPTHAEWDPCYLEDKYTMTYKERKVRKGARGDLEEAKMIVILERFKKVISDFLSSDKSGGESSIMGIYHFLSQSNVVGGISQVGNPWWQANVHGSTGALATADIDSDYDEIASKRGTPPDLVLASYNASLSVYGRFRDFITTPLRFMVNPESNSGIAKYGFTTLEYNGMQVVMDTRGRTGTYAMLSSETIFWDGNEKPMIEGPRRVPGTTTDEKILYMMGLLACSDPARNTLRTGISG